MQNLIQWSLPVHLLFLLTSSTCELLCGSSGPPSSRLTELSNLDRLHLQQIGFGSASRQAALLVPVHFHVIYDSISRKGLLNESSLQYAVDSLNSAYTANAQLQFYLASYEFIDAVGIGKPNWFNMTQGNPEEIEMKTALHKGSARSLNFYTLNLLNWGGYSTFPPDTATSLVIDGVMVRWEYLQTDPLSLI
eukprot:TRINITY_DN11096_c0_g1_i2.p1 TRINITY_DN11096_c0_g1~~TRINITY_DN11096_c0_g1_i2.p1  ORF type:complete len:192 (+),score=25.03 TRINITY_DN11096_c0_g1_i2:171-746(+)